MTLTVRATVVAPALERATPALADDNAVVPAATVTRAVWSAPAGSVRVGPVHARRAVAAGQCLREHRSGG